MRLVSRIHPADLPSDLGQFVDQLFGGSASPRGFTPPTDIEEAEQQFILSMELPGLDAEQVDVEVVDDCLKISGERPARTADDAKKLHQSERCRGSFQRKFEFPVQVDFDKIDAHFEKGVLTVTVPKSERSCREKSKSKQTGRWAECRSRNAGARRMASAVP